jgi:hypothetical protein
MLKIFIVSSVSLFLYLSVSLSLCLSVSLSLCLSVSLSLCLSVSLSLCLYGSISLCFSASLPLCLSTDMKYRGTYRQRFMGWVVMIMLRMRELYTNPSKTKQIEYFEIFGLTKQIQETNLLKIASRNKSTKRIF